MLMCRLFPTIDVSGTSAADSARYGIRAKITISAAAPYTPASGPRLIRNNLSSETGQ